MRLPDFYGLYCTTHTRTAGRPRLLTDPVDLFSFRLPSANLVSVLRLSIRSDRRRTDTILLP